MADQGACDDGERGEVFGFAVVAANEAAVAHEPGHGSFDDPAVAAQALGRLNALAGYTHRDAADLHGRAEWFLVVGLVRVQFLGPAPWSAPAAGWRR